METGQPKLPRMTIRAERVQGGALTGGYADRALVRRAAHAVAHALAKDFDHFAIEGRDVARLAAADLDGNGKVDPYDIGDGVMAQGRYMCAIATTIDGWIAD